MWNRWRPSRNASPRWTWTVRSRLSRKKIAALDADRRERQLEDRRDGELKRLAAAIAAIR